MKENIFECSKVRNRPVVYSRREAGASMYFGHISRCVFFCFCFFFVVFFFGGGVIRPVNIISLILSRVSRKMGRRREIPEKNHLITRKQTSQVLRNNIDGP